MKRILRITVVAFFVSCGIAHARPVLLTSFRQDALAGGGSGPITDLRAQFVLQLPTSPPLGPPVDPFVGLGQGVWWQEGDQGFVDFSAGNDPLFGRVCDSCGRRCERLGWHLHPMGRLHSPGIGTI